MTGKDSHVKREARSLGTCRACDKRSFTTRREARKHRRGGSGCLTGLSAYPCPHTTGLWHLGHLPPQVIAGDKDRSEIRTRRNRNT